MTAHFGAGVSHSLVASRIVTYLFFFFGTPNSKECRELLTRNQSCFVNQNESGFVLYLMFGIGFVWLD